MRVEVVLGGDVGKEGVDIDTSVSTENWTKKVDFAVEILAVK